MVWGLVLAAGLVGPAWGAERVVHRAEGRFGPIFVVDDGDDRYLRFGSPAGDDQTWVKKSAPGALPMEYLRSAAVGLSVDPKSVLLIGLGGGGFATYVRQKRPGVVVEGVEIDPAVVRVARSHFKLPKGVKVHVADGAAFLDRSKRRWGFLLVDAYGAEGYPRALGTAAFFADVKARLDEGGVAVLNLAVEDKATELRLLRRFDAAMDACLVLPVTGAEALNVVVLGARGTGALDELEEKARAAEAELGLPLGRLVKTAQPCSGREERPRSPPPTTPGQGL